MGEVILFLIVLIWLLARHLKAKSLLSQWAIENDYKVLVKELKIQNAGPVFGEIIGLTYKYKVFVEGKNGSQINGYVIMPCNFFGFFNNTVEDDLKGDINRCVF